MKPPTLLFCAAWFATSLATGVPAVATPAAPVVVSGTVGSEMARAALLSRLRALYGARVVDQLEVGVVATPANWDALVAGLITPELRGISGGQLAIDGIRVSLRGAVASEAARRQIGADIVARLNPTYTIDNALRVAQPAPAPESRQAVLDQTLARRIVEFESGQATLTARGRAILDEMGTAMLRMPDTQVAVIGHTDNLGARARNLALSQARADTVKRYLVSKGVAAQLVVAGVGPDRPLADNRTAEGRARNRRIEFRAR